MNFHKRHTGLIKPTFTLEHRNDSINQMSLNNALSSLHKKINELDKTINVKDKQQNENGSTSQYIETIVFDLQKNIHHMEQQILELFKNFDFLRSKLYEQEDLILNQDIFNTDKIDRKYETIPNDIDLKYMIEPLIELISTKPELSDYDEETSYNINYYSDRSNNYVSLYDISYQYFIDSSLLDNIQDFEYDDTALN